MKVNADIGESFGSWTMANDEAIMPLIDQANIACGYHAGDAVVIQQTIALAKQHNVEIGAHVSYPDLQGFGRRSMAIDSAELQAMIHAQIALLDGMSKCQQMLVTYVKPHGALYNDMMRDEAIFNSVLNAVASYPLDLSLVIQAAPIAEHYKNLASPKGVTIVAEAFADRAYLDSGLLAPRNMRNAVLSVENALAQVKTLVEHQSVTTVSGQSLALQADTLCVHGDSPSAINMCEQIRALLP